MITTNSTLTGNISFSQPQQTNHDPILPVQIWQEGRKRGKTQRLVFVNAVTDQLVGIRNIVAGQNTVTDRRRFNRGKTGFFFVAHISDLKILNSTFEPSKAQLYKMNRGQQG